MLKGQAADKKNVVKFVGNVVSALSILFILAALFRTDFASLPVTDWRMFLPVFAAGTAAKAATVFVSALAWCLWLEFFAGRRCSRREALRVYAKANIGKYLPGNVMHYVERNLFAGRLQLSQKQLALASVSEMVSLVLAAFGVGLLFGCLGLQDTFGAVLRQLPFVREYFEAADGNGSLGRLFVIVAAAIFVTVAGVFALVWNRRSKQVRIGKRGTVSRYTVRVFAKTFFRSMLLYAFVLLVLGLLLVLCYWSMGGALSVQQALWMTASYVAAWVIGFVVPGAPGGIGVREMALTLLAAPVMGRDRIVVLSVLHRLMTVAGDLAAYLLRGKLLGRDKADERESKR